MRKRAAGGLSAGPESSDEELGSLLMRTGSVMWVFVERLVGMALVSCTKHWEVLLLDQCWALLSPR